MRARVLGVALAGLCCAAGLQVMSAAPASAGCSFTVSSISPSVGFVAGGASATISGCGFTTPGTYTVQFGATAAFSVTPSTDTTIPVTSVPAASGAGPVTVTVDLHPTSGPDVTGTTSYSYVNPPAITSIVPVKGPADGGTDVLVTGTDLDPTGATNTEVDFGATAGTISNLTDTSALVTAPAGTGTVNVTATVTLSGGAQSTSTGTNDYTYVPAPTVTSVTPASGAVTGGTDVTVTGTGFQDGAEVLFGPSDGTTSLKVDLPGAPIQVLSSTSILVTTPPGIVGATNVVVVNPDTQIGVLESSNSSHFSFTGTPPAITMVSPGSGTSLGGTPVTITGSGFLSGAQVDFDISTTVASGSNGVSVSSFTGSGTLDVASTASFPATGSLSVQTSTGTAIVSYTGTTSTSFTGCTLTSGAAGSGTLATGNDVTASAAASGVTVSSDGTTITATTPAHPAGTVDVVVTNQGGGVATSSGAFTYLAAAAPTITSLGQTSGSSLGNTQFTISGTNFVVGSTVSFGSTPAASAGILNPSTITVTTPAHQAGAVPVTVTLPDGQSVQSATSFTFNAAPAPTITQVMPSSGPNGTQITITGTGFANTNGTATNAASAAVVTVGSSPCVPGSTSGAPTTCLQVVPPGPIVQSATTIVGVVPDAPGGAATVTVLNPDGQSATSSFTYTGTSGPPSLTSVSPGTGTTLGDTPVTLTGTGFVDGAVVTFGSGGLAAPGTVTGVSSDGTTISVTTPAGVYGTVDVTVVDPPGGSGQTSTLPDAFDFTTAPAPTITSVIPNTGPSGTEITITGTGFAFVNGSSSNAPAPATVTIGGQPLLPVSSTPPALPPPVVVSSTTITGVVPTEAAGTVDVAVVNPDGQGVIDSGAYTYPADTTPPTVTATGTSNGSPYTFGTWATSSVSVALNSVDNAGGSGVKNLTYSASGAQTINSTTVSGANATLQITQQGTTTVSYSSSDNAGNVSSPQSSTVMIDSIPPTDIATATIPSGGGTVAYTPGNATNQDVTVTFSCSDGGSGVGSLTYTSTSTTTTSGSDPLSVTVTSAGANQSVTATCTDVAGNVTKTTFSGIDIVRTAPTITASATSGGQPYTAGVWTDEAVTVTFACTPISVGNQVAFLTAPVQVAGPTTNDTVSGTCTDSAGNSSHVTFGTSSAGIDIDLTLPLVTASATTTTNTGATVPYTAGTWTNHNVVVTFTCTDSGPNQSGVASVTPPVTVSAPGTTAGVTGQCTDVAGNQANPPAFFGPILIDKTPPTCSVLVSPNPIGPANGKLVGVTAIVTVSDGQSGPHGFQLVSVTSSNPSTASSDIQGFSPGAASTTGQLRATKGLVYTFTYEGFDVAGNTSAVCSTQVSVR